MEHMNKFERGKRYLYYFLYKNI